MMLVMASVFPVYIPVALTWNLVFVSAFCVLCFANNYAIMIYTAQEEQLSSLRKVKEDAMANKWLKNEE